jgi:CBS domain-containing protein
MIMATTLFRNRRRVALKRLKAANVMDSNPASVRDTATVRSAVDILNRYGSDMVPVTDESGRLIGIVSGADLFDTHGRLRNRQQDCDTTNITNAGIYHKPGRRRAGLMVRQVMSPEVFRVRSDASIAKVIETFVKRKIRRLFVTDQDALLVGEIDIFELLRTLGEYVDPIRISRQRPK